MLISLVNTQEKINVNSKKKKPNWLMDFFKLFEKNYWQPVMYKRKLIRISDTIPVLSDTQVFKVTFENSESNWEQGVFFYSKDAHFFAADFNRIDGFHCWQKGSEKEVQFKVRAPEKQIKIWNVWKTDSGFMQYGHNGAAMYYEEIPNGKRYFCNDGFPDDDFNDLIFTLTWDNENKLTK